MLGIALLEVQLLALEHLSLDLVVRDLQMDTRLHGQLLLPIFVHQGIVKFAKIKIIIINN